MTSNDEKQGRPGGHFRAHAVAVGLVAVASVIGAIAAFVFQILTARLLSVEEFGLLAAFFAIVNVAAIGSSALQNSVAVQTALETSEGRRAAGLRIPIDALVVGGLGGVVIAVLSPVLSTALDAGVGVVVAAAVCMPLSFLFAGYLGRIQGTGHAQGAVLWSTVSLIARVLIVVPALLLGWGIAGAIGAVVLASTVALVGAAISARTAPSPARSVFSRNGMTVVVISVAFAWLISADVFFMRMLSTPEAAGSYAAVAVLVKASFLLPSTLSMYLLPRFTRNRTNAELTRVGTLAAAGLSAAAMLVLVTVFFFLGDPIIHLLYGERYADAVSLLVPVAAAYTPWVVLQGAMIHLTSSASRPAALVLLVAVGVQGVAFFIVLPDVSAMLWWFASIGTVLLLVFLLLTRAATRTLKRMEAPRE